MCIIPSEVFRKILSKVPAEPLLRFRCVCKAWRDTIDDPVFVKLHLDNIHDSSSGTGQIILRGELCNCFYSIPFESIESDCSKIVKPVFLKDCPFESYVGTKSFFASCNGVILIYLSKGICFLWNPLTMEHRRMPALKAVSRKSMGLYHSVSGLGYDYASDDYKVVKISQVYDPRDKILKSETFVYSLKLDSWRRIKDFPYRISRLRGGKFVKGALHWICSTIPQKSKDDLIVCLDLETEDYYLLPMPSGLSGPVETSAKHLDVLGGCLVLSCYYQIERLDVWSMKDYGVSNSWIKLLSIAVGDSIGAVESLRPIALSKCRGVVLLQHNKKEFVWFNLDAKLGEKIRINGHLSAFSSYFFVGSLVRLNPGFGYGDVINGKESARNEAEQL